MAVDNHMTIREVMGSVVRTVLTAVLFPVAIAGICVIGVCLAITYALLGLAWLFIVAYAFARLAVVWDYDWARRLAIRLSLRLTITTTQVDNHDHPG